MCYTQSIGDVPYGLIYKFGPGVGQNEARDSETRPLSLLGIGVLHFRLSST